MRSKEKWNLRWLELSGWVRWATDGGSHEENGEAIHALLMGAVTGGEVSGVDERRGEEVVG